MWWRLLKLLLAVALIGHCSARRLDHVDGRSLHSTHPGVQKPASEIRLASEVKDLMSAGTAPTKTRKMKNMSGKTDEGGFYKTYGSDAEGEKGYLKESYSKGDHGYKTLDTFHKQDGDKYGFEKYSAYGKARAGKGGASQSKSGAYSNKRNADGDHEGSGTIVHSHYHNSDGNHNDESALYTGDADGGHYSNEHGSQSASAGHGAGSYGYGHDHSENYSAESGDGGSDGSHSSYTHGSDVDGNYEGSYY